jgi:hypothetical protein
VACPDPGRPGPCENGHVEGVFRRDVKVGETARYRRFRGPLVHTRLSRARPVTTSRARQRNVSLATSDELVVAAWEERRGGHDRVFTALSRDGGTHWSRARRPGSGGGDEQWPAVAVGAGDRVTVAWSLTRGGTTRVVFARSAAGAAEFSSPRAIDASPPASVAQWKPALAQGPGDTVHAAWIDERERSADDGLPQAHLFYKRIGGGSGSRKLDVGGPVTLAAKLDHAWAPRIASRGRRVLVTWLDFQNYDWGVFSRLSANGGASFGVQVRVTTNREDNPATPDNEQQEELADSPDPALGARTPLIAWTDWRKRNSSATKPHQEYDVFIAAPGARNRQVDPYGGRQLSTFAPSICVTPGGDALVAFQDSSKGRSEVRIVTMRGGTVRGPARLVSDAGARGGNAWRPRIACLGDRVVAVWEDERDGPVRLHSAVGSARKLR